MHISSVTNSKVKQWSKLKQKKYREQAQQFLIEGDHLLEAAKGAGVVETIISLPQYQQHYQADYTVSDTVMKKLCTTVSLTKVVAVCRYIQPSITKSQRVVLLDQVQDPGNVGTIIRTAHAFGFDEVFLDSSVDPYNDKVIRSTQGALFTMRVTTGDIMEKIEELCHQGIPVYYTALKNAVSIDTIPVTDTVAVIFGNEGQGVRDAIKNSDLQAIYIDIMNVESLNVAVAAGIVMNQFKKR